MYVYFFCVKFPACTHLIRTCTFIYFEEFSRLYVYTLLYVYLFWPNIAQIRTGKNLLFLIRVRHVIKTPLIKFEGIVGDSKCYTSKLKTFAINRMFCYKFERLIWIRTFKSIQNKSFKVLNSMEYLSLIYKGYTILKSVVSTWVFYCWKIR